MSALNQQQIESRMLNGMRFTYADLCRDYTKGITAVEGWAQKAHMQIDRTIQKLRKAGKIKMRRTKAGVVWSKVGAPEADASLS